MVSAVKIGWKQGCLNGNLDSSGVVIVDDGTCVIKDAWRYLGACSLKCEKM
jgi:hypothetical protein